MTLTATRINPPGGYENLSRLCRAAGDPLRLEILRSLARDSYGVLELCRIFGMRQPAMSHHLKVLAEAGLVYRRREGTSIFYGRHRRAPSGELEPVMQAIFAAADLVPLGAATAQGVSEVQTERAASSREFFAANADKFRAQQELIAPRGQYEDPVLGLLATLLPQRCALALELGPGEGWLLPALARRSRRVVAIDNAAAMLEQARAACAAAGLANVELVLADSSHARALAAAADIAVANMVLHHTASPAVVLADLAAALRPGGLLLLTDLCAHDQAWAREACGDLWLGFEPESLSRWAADAGLAQGESVYLALRNGFRIQVRVFHRTA
ncbi:MAG: metalloregulator ArsR/SmtB family transcription factor [Pseudomonadales bacterium]|jgi:ArsR family transcriptional regulator|nr:metalloregulator ArsR/SmtB family transcription factor [Pseudomonadales bacterium]